MKNKYKKKIIIIIVIKKKKNKKYKEGKNCYERYFVKVQLLLKYIMFD